MTNNINIIFDFDGVILDSNDVKTIAFKNISRDLVRVNQIN